MDLNNEKYIILELIPNSLNHEKGDIVQFSALKLDGIKLIDRFDYRLNDDLVTNPDLKNMISYDKDKFIYTDKNILEIFKEFIEDYDLVIIDNEYTKEYLKDINNKKESIFNLLNMEFNDDIFNSLINKYSLEYSDHLVDLMYESMIYESNNK